TAIAWSTRFANSADLVLAPSDFVAARLRASGVRRPVEVVPTGIDLARFQPGDRAAARQALGLPEAGPVLLYVGRLDREKNLEFLLAAVSRLAGPAPPRLLLVGRGTRSAANWTGGSSSAAGSRGTSSGRSTMPRSLSSSRRPPRRRGSRCWRRWPAGCRWWRCARPASRRCWPTASPGSWCPRSRARLRRRSPRCSPTATSPRSWPRADGRPRRRSRCRWSSPAWSPRTGGPSPKPGDDERGRSPPGDRCPGGAPGGRPGPRGAGDPAVPGRGARPGGGAAGGAARAAGGPRPGPGRRDRPWRRRRRGGGPPRPPRGPQRAPGRGAPHPTLADHPARGARSRAAPGRRAVLPRTRPAVRAGRRRARVTRSEEDGMSEERERHERLQARLAAGERIEAADEMSATYRDCLIHLMTMQADSELAGAYGYVPWIMKAPGVEE